MAQRFSPSYVEHLKLGPFPGRIDPFAEDEHYFHQIHAGMISNLQDQMQNELMARGYQAGREASLQIVANRQPDIYIEEQRTTVRDEAPPIHYEAVAAELQVEAGTVVADQEIELDAIHIYDFVAGDLVTVIEIISPSNKADYQRMERYREQRSSLFLAQGVNVVEIDPTRSIRHLLRNSLIDTFPYHIAVYLPDALPRVLGSQLEEGLKPFALPLRGEAIRVETHQAYQSAYRSGAIAGQLEHNNRYLPDTLPFPSTLTDAQRQSALEAVKSWSEGLARLREENQA